MLNAHFEEGEGQSWLAFEKGFRVERAASHPEGMDGNSLVLENTGDAGRRAGRTRSSSSTSPRRPRSW